MTKDLRVKLAELVSAEDGKNWYIPELFERITLPRLPSDLIVLEIPPSPEKNYNCFIYALALSHEQNIIKETNGFIFSSFFQKLISEHEVKEHKHPKSGDLIVYYNHQLTEGEITHIGIVQDDGSIISKWSWGPLLKHRVFAVPNYYGDSVKYFNSLETQQAIQLYEKYKNFNV